MPLKMSCSCLLVLLWADDDDDDDDDDVDAGMLMTSSSRQFSSQTAQIIRGEGGGGDIGEEGGRWNHFLIDY